jgi:chaperonin cofactor prefoldin
MGIYTMTTDSKLKTLTKQIESASNSLEQLALQERDLLRELEEFKCQITKDNSNFPIKVSS